MELSTTNEIPEVEVRVASTRCSEIVRAMQASKLMRFTKAS